jgi:hypothetical protein
MATIPMNTLIATASAGVTCHTSLADGLEACRQRYQLNKTQMASVLSIPASHYSDLIATPQRRPVNIKIAARALAIGVPAEVLLQNRSFVLETSDE